MNLKNILLVSLICMAMQSNYALAEAYMPGVYVRNQIKPAQEATDKIISIAKKTCDLVKHKEIKIFGLANYAKGTTVEEYYSADGAYMAIYSKGYRNDGKDVCVINFKPYKDIQIYQTKQKNHYSYQSYKGVWVKTKQASMADAEPIVGLLNAAAEQHNGKAVYLGKQIFQTNKVQALSCHKYQFKEMTWCEWRKDSDAYNFLAPVRIILKGHVEKLSSSEVEQVNFSAMIPALIFEAPEKYEDMTSSRNGLGKNNATAQWCLVQEKKTGVNPCEEDEDE
jgi:hypothetical protein